MKLCAQPDCEQSAGTRGFCNRHYRRWLRHGDPSIVYLPRPASLAEAVAAYLARCIRLDSGCVVHPGGTTYGDIRWEGRRSTAHRAIYIHAHGEISRNLVVRHHCDNPPCVNLDHLAAGTATQNSQDMIARGRQGRSGVPGESNPWAKLTADNVAEMRRMVRAGSSIRAAARHFGVAHSCALSAVRGRTWAHVTEEPPLLKGDPRRSHPSKYRIPDEDARAALALYEQGRSLAEIGSLLGRDRVTIHRIIRRLNEERAA